VSLDDGSSSSGSGSGSSDLAAAYEALRAPRHCSPAPLSGLYGLWRRTAARGELDCGERRKRDAEETWDLRHVERADELDSLEGRTVRLRVAHEALDGETYPAGEPFVVRGRVRDILLCEALERGADPVVLSLKAHWVRA